MNAVVITVSDSCFAGKRQDLSGPAVAETLARAGFDASQSVVLPDEASQISDALRQFATKARLIVTAGGTGISARDVTPEATRLVCDRILDGFGELMRSEGRKTTTLAVMSRAVSGTLGTTLIVNVPGSPAAAVESLEAVLPLIPHALALLAGNTGHDPVKR